MTKLKKKPPCLRGKALAKHIFGTWRELEKVTGVPFTTCRNWVKNNVPAWHRAAVCSAAVAKYWDVEEDDFRGDL